MDLVPEGMINYMLVEEGYNKDEFDDMVANLSDDIQQVWDVLDDRFGDEWNLTYDIINDSLIEDDELEEIRDDYSEMGLEVSKAREIELELIIAVGDEENTTTLDLPLVKIGRNWYIDTTNGGGLF